MQRSELEHILWAAGAVTNSPRIVVIGSQALLATSGELPEELTHYEDADLYPLEHPERSRLLEAALGEESEFHEQFGYYVRGAGPSTALLPSQWLERVVRLQVPGVEGLCLSPVDLAVSKLLAGRLKDFEFVRAMIKNGFLTKAEIEATIQEMGPAEAERVKISLQLSCR